MNGFMLAGVITGIVVGLVLVAVGLTFIKKDKKEKFVYDERQTAARGTAYKYAFFTLMIYNVILACVDIALDKPWAEPMAAEMIGICLALIVLVVYCIWHDCYFSMNEEPKKVMIFFGIVFILNAIIGVVAGVNGHLIESGMLTNQSANLIVAVLFGAVFAALAIRTATNKDEGEEED